MPMKAKLRADLISAGEGAFWLAMAWVGLYGSLANNLWLCLLPFGLGSIAIALCFMNRRASVVMGRYRVRARRTDMLWHLVVIPMLLAPLIWIVLESLLGSIDEHRYKLALIVILSTAGWLFFLLTAGFKRVFQKVQNNRTPSHEYADLDS